MEEAFSRIYEQRTWCNDAVPNCPLSGPGSTSEATAPLRHWLTTFLATTGAASMVDLGCGDHRAMHDLELPATVQRYTGIDCVAPVLEAAERQYGSSVKAFVKADIADPAYIFPPGDVALFKDVLSHWPNHVVLGTLWRMLKQRAYKHIVLVHCAHQSNHWQDMPQVQQEDANGAFMIGDFRPLNFNMLPLSIFSPSFLFAYGSKHVYMIDAQAWQPPAPLPALGPLTAQMPSVGIAILVKDKQFVLPHYLANIEALQYPKQCMHIYIRTNNNKDGSREILADWVERHQGLGTYASIHFDDSDVTEQVQRFGEHEWTHERFKVLGAIRQASMQWAIDKGLDYYYVQDCDNFVIPTTLADLVALQLPIVAPLVRICENQNRAYANYHSATDANGYYAAHPHFFSYFHRAIKGIVEQPVVHCTYLVQTCAAKKLTYDDGSGRYEYVIFAHSARTAGVPQYLDTRRFWGCLTFQSAEFDPQAVDCMLATQFGTQTQ